MENKFDTQFLIEGHDLDEDAIHDGILNSAKGDCLLVVGDEDVVKVHYHTDQGNRIKNIHHGTKIP